MRLRHIRGAEQAIATSPYVIQQPQEYQGRFHQLFGNRNPLRIEVGMGKGRFIMELASQNPQVNYIGIERYSSVLLRALQKREELALPNIYFMCEDAKLLSEIFGPGEIDRIYLNFSDPWPKDRHARRRLPSREFLARYGVILKQGGRLEFKTDNRALFDFALDELGPAGWEAEEVTYDLHGDPRLMEGNVMTEYEEKFSSRGAPICKYIIHPGSEMYENR